MSAGHASWLRRDGDALLIEVRVLARAPRDEVVGERGGRLALRVVTAPVDGAANERALALLARELGVPRGQTELLAGARGRNKRVRVQSPRRRPPWLPAAF